MYNHSCAYAFKQAFVLQLFRQDKWLATITGSKPRLDSSMLPVAFQALECDQ